MRPGILVLDFLVSFLTLRHLSTCPNPTAYQIFTVYFTVDPNNPNNKEIQIRVGLQLLVSGFMEIMSNKIMFTTRIHF